MVWSVVSSDDAFMCCCPSGCDALNALATSMFDLICLPIQSSTMGGEHWALDWLSEWGSCKQEYAPKNMHISLDFARFSFHSPIAPNFRRRLYNLWSYQFCNAMRMNLKGFWSEDEHRLSLTFSCENSPESDGKSNVVRAQPFIVRDSSTDHAFVRM